MKPDPATTDAAVGFDFSAPIFGARGLLAKSIILISGGLVPWISFVGDRWLDYLFPAASALLWVALARGGVSWWDYFRAVPRFLAVTITGLILLSAVAATRVFDHVDLLEKIRLILVPGTVYLCLYLVVAMWLMRDWPLQRAVIRAVYVGLAIGCVLLAADTASGGELGQAIFRPIIGKAFHSAYFNRAEMMLAILAWTTAPVMASRFGNVAGLTAPTAIWILAMFGESETVQAGLPISALVYLVALKAPRLARASVFTLALLALLFAPLLYPILFEVAPAIPLLSSQKFLVRSEIWDAVSRFALDAPFTGHGLKATRFAGPVPMAGLYNPEQSIWHPHNGFLQLWADLGFFGVACVAGTIFGIWRTIGCLAAAAQPTIIASFTMVVLSVVSTHDLWAAWWLGFISFNAGYLVVITAAIRSDTVATLIPRAIR